jgi:hypothetical protein
MSIECVTLVMYGLRNVSPAQKLLMMILAEHARRGSAVAWPRVGKLADLACLKRRQVQENLRKLTRAEWISVEGSGKGGHALSTRYRVNVERLMKSATEYVRDDKKFKNGAEQRALIGALRCAVTTSLTSERRPAQGTAQFSASNGAPKHANGALDRSPTVRPSAPEPVLNPLLTGFEPDAHARASGGASTVSQTANPLIERIKPERPRQRSREEQLAFVAANMKDTGT